MKSSYIVLIFADAASAASYLREVAETVRAVSAGQMKRAESAPGITALAFVTDKDRAATMRALEPLWRMEQRLWVLPLDSDPPPLFIDKAIADWARKAAAN